MRPEHVQGPLARWQSQGWALADVVSHESGFGTVPSCLRHTVKEALWLCSVALGPAVQGPRPETLLRPSPELHSLGETQALMPKSDFRPFMLQGVACDVRNAAVQKRFTDPLPAGMLDIMVCAKLLNLFESKDPKGVWIENFYDPK